MASRLQLHLLREGQAVWNLWRQQHSRKQPNLREADLAGVSLRRVNLCGARLSGADLREADLSDADLSYADLCGAQMNGAKLRRACLDHARLSRAHLSGVRLNNASLKGADLSHAILTGADLRNADLHQAELSETALDGANLNGADLTEAKLYKAKLQGVKLLKAKLCSARLNGANLTDASLDQANLAGANLYEAVLEYTSLNGASLRDACLCQVRLLHASLVRANMDGCQVAGMVVQGVKFQETTQQNLVISLPGTPAVLTDHLEVARFLELLSGRERLRDLIENISTRFVLLLGSFSATWERTCAALRAHGYHPVSVDGDKVVHRDVTQILAPLARLACLLITDQPETSDVVVQIRKLCPALPIISYQFLEELAGNEKVFSYQIQTLSAAALTQKQVSTAEPGEIFASKAAAVSEGKAKKKKS